MSIVADPHMISSVDELRVGKFIAYHVHDNLHWGQGDIRPQSLFMDADDQQSLLTAVMQSLELVSDTELAYSACTDGRMPIRLLDGHKAIPVREQMVGADIVSAFYVAEVLGDRFYKNMNAPVEERLRDVALFLHDNGLAPSSHIACGAATNFVTILENIRRFAAGTEYRGRLHALLPHDIYSPELHRTVLDAIHTRLTDAVYEGLTAQTFIDAVKWTGGSHAIEELRDDGRGVHGHVEEQIIRIRVPGYAINETKLAQLTDGREVFGVNDNRVERIAQLFGRGKDSDYKLAYIALEEFIDAAHGTLARDLPTYIIE